MKNWLASPDVPIEVPRCTRGCSSCCCQLNRRIVPEGVEERGNLRKDTVFSGMARLYRVREAEPQFIEYLRAKAVAELATEMAAAAATDAIPKKRNAIFPKSTLICCPLIRVRREQQRGNIGARFCERPIAEENGDGGLSPYKWFCAVITVSILSGICTRRTKI